MSEIVVIGVSGAGLDRAGLDLLRGCAALVVSRRFRPLVEGLGRPLLPMAPVAAMLGELEAALEGGRVGVLASGDPLFFGIGRTLIDRFGRERVDFHPALSALQLACARMGEPWDGLPCLSLHGRDMADLPGRVLGQERTMLFTDHRNSPDRVARALLDTLDRVGAGELRAAVRLRVAENLGMADERLVEGGLEEMAAISFGDLNMVLVSRPAPARPFHGLGAEELVHSRGLITKDEARAVALHQLRLPAEGVFWDLGGGSGSLSIEAARLAPGLRVFSVERRAEEQANIKANIVRHEAWNLRLVSGEAPAVLAALPDPDRVFVGGSGGQLAAMIQVAARRLRPGGRIVLNAVLKQTAAQAPALLAAQGLRVTARRVEVTRLDYGSDGAAVEQPQNPITIMTGTR